MEDKIRVLLTEEEVNEKIKKIGEQVSKDYAGKSVHMICVLKGGVFFTCELAKRITVPVSLDFMSVSSYGSETKSSGIVKIIKDLDEPLEGKDVLIVEDIIDSGRTLSYLIEILKKAELKPDRLKLDTSKIMDDGKITKDEYKRMARPALLSSIIGVIIGIIPGTGASMASWFSYDVAKNMSRHKEEFGHGSVEGIAAAESANNAVTGATLIPLLTLGIPGDGCVAIMLSALMINGLNPGLSLFTTQGDIMYAIMLGLLFVNLFMLLQGKYLTKLFAKVVSIPQEILTPIIVIFCFAGAYSVNKSYFDVAVTLTFAVIAWLLYKLDFPTVPILLGLVLGNMTETNFRRALLISEGNPSIFVSSPYCIAFIILIIGAVAMIIRSKLRDRNVQKGA